MKKFYKITNQEENHCGMQYQTGENVDILPFNPDGYCKKGGIYFTDTENILAFLDYGCWIREVTLPEGEEVYENPTIDKEDPKKWKAHRIILGERELITSEVIERLILEGADVHVGNNLALRWASYLGNFETVKVLLEAGADVHANYNEALRWVSFHGHANIVRLLLEHGACVHENDCEALRLASRYGYIEIVELLLKHGADVHANNDEALRRANRNGHVEVVKVLLEHGADPDII